MAWFDTPQKTYRTSDPEEAKFLRASTNWNVILEEEENASTPRSKKRHPDEFLREARQEMGLPEQPQSRTEDPEYTVTTDAELNSLARQAKAEIQNERTKRAEDMSAFELYSDIVATAFQLEKQGRTEFARRGYGAAITFLNTLNESLFETNPNETEARQMIQQKRRAIKSRLANL